MQKLAKKHRMVMVVPIYEEEQPGVYYNTAAVIDADGKYLGKYRKTHIPHCKPGLLGEVLLPAGQPRLSRVRDAVRAESACTSATTGTSPKARAPGAERRRDRLQPVGDGRRACPSTCGSSSSRRTPSPTATSSARSTASARKPRGTSASSTARATSATRGARSSPKRPRDKDEVVVADLDLDMIERCDASGSSTATAGPRRTAPSSRRRGYPWPPISQ